jgi:hypothetical protein
MEQAEAKRSTQIIEQTMSLIDAPADTTEPPIKSKSRPSREGGNPETYSPAYRAI